MKFLRFIGTTLALALLLPPVWKLEDKTQLIRPMESEVSIGPSHKEWVPYSNIPVCLVRAILASEDTEFANHHGVSYAESWNSLKQNFSAGHIVRGGSTITQQVVKMAFLTKEKTYTRKIREILGAYLLEVLLTKKEIFEWYVNLARFGENVYGLRQAAHFYFHTEPENMTAEQSIYLATILPSPVHYGKDLEKKNLSARGIRRFINNINTQNNLGWLSNEELVRLEKVGNFGRSLIVSMPFQRLAFQKIVPLQAARISSVEE